MSRPSSTVSGDLVKTFIVVLVSQPDQKDHHSLWLFWDLGRGKCSAFIRESRVDEGAAISDNEWFQGVLAKQKSLPFSLDDREADGD